MRARSADTLNLPRAAGATACFAGVLAIAFSTVATAEIYRWVDDNGVVQFSDKPPPDQQSETVEIRATSRPASNGPPTNAPKPLAQSTGAAPADAQPEPTVSPEQQAEIDAVRAENCRRAQSNLQFLQDNPPSRLLDTDAQGNVYRLTVEDHTARMQTASDAVDKYCED